jgi:23S rRNA (uracil1939-C5)-methyltransferase
LNRFCIYHEIVADNPLSIGDKIRIQVDRLAFGGEGVARHEGLVIFVPFAAKGDTLDVQVTEIKKNFARASIIQVIKPSVERREPPCQYYSVCGGCQLQHINYQAQLVAKADFIRDSLRKIGGIQWQQEIEVKSGSELGYRSRAQLKLDCCRGAQDRTETPVATGAESEKRLLVGFHRKGSHSVCDIERCAVLEPPLNATLASLRSSLNDSCAGGRDFPRTIDLACGDSIVAADPPVGGLPPGPIKRRIGAFVYEFGPSTFFQANPSMLSPLIESATDGTGGELAVDLYAGVGLFTLPLAGRFNEVIGVEANSEAAQFAERNIAASGLNNIKFRRRRSEDWLNEYVQAVSAGKHPVADFMLLDPPRGGIEGAGIHLIRAAPARICYVSCNPTTLSRDLARLVKHGYFIEEIVGLDLFPQTYHVETVVRLSRASSLSGRSVI